MPVISPKNLIITPNEMKERFGTEVIITNAYIIRRDESLANKALTNGLHKFLGGFDGAIATDSGAFQLMVYGDVEISNQEITIFQEKIGSDIGVFLDIPTARGAKKDFEDGVHQTIERADEHITCRQRKDILWLGPIQGGPYPDLVEKAAQAIGKRPFDLHALGSVVPLLEAYKYEIISEMILAAKRNIPIDRPIHLFGGGHPSFFALSVLLGIDLFDSAAYILFARQKRYLTPHGTLLLDKLQYFPCSCPVCMEYTPKKLRKQNKEELTRNLALHNLYVSFAEINTIKSAIGEGRLFELALNRAITHPKLTKALNIFQNEDTKKIMEFLDPITKPRALMIPHLQLIAQPLVFRFMKRFQERFFQWHSKLVIVSPIKQIPSTPDAQVIQISPLFGPVPLELKSIYPLYQHIAIDLDISRVIPITEQFLKENESKFDEVIIDERLKPLFSNYGEFKKLTKQDFGKEPENFLNAKIKAVIEYQFGRNASIHIKKPFGEFSKTGLLRKVFDGDVFLGTVRAHDFYVIPQPDLALRLFNSLPKGKLQVVAAQEALSFIKKRRALFAKFVMDVDLDIRANEEVLIVNENGELIGSGKAELSAKEMLVFKKGVAVSTRHSF
jgi:7-cyano-7-deazaguanine tRNA-ribosyltransferase